MSKIVTLTLSPVIDKSTSVGALAPEKKLRCTEPKFEPGGGGINIARAINQLGGSALAIYPAGGHAGHFLKALLDEQGLQSEVIEVAAPTRENLIVVEESTNNQYRFGMPGAPITEAELEQCFAAVARQDDMEYLVASGSIPPGVTDDVFARLASIAKEKGARFIADTSGPALRAAAGEGVFLLKPNLAELSSLVGRNEIHLEKVDDVARELIREGGCELVAVSLGPAGAVLVTSEYVYMVTPPPVRKRSTVGAGDSMVAGLVLALAEGKDLSEVLCFGVAAGTAATMNPGTELCHRADVDRLLPKLHVQRLKEL